MKIVMFHPNVRPDDFDTALQPFPDVTFVRTSDDAALRAELPGAEVLIVGNRFYTDAAPTVLRYGTRLRWIQFFTSGLDGAKAAGFPSGVMVTNMPGRRAFAVAEHAMALMLGLVRRVRDTEAARARQFWTRDVTGPSIDNLAGKHLLVIGTRLDRSRDRAQGQGLRHAGDRHQPHGRRRAARRPRPPAQRARGGLP